MGRLLEAGADVNAMVAERNQVRTTEHAKYARMCQLTESRLNNGIERGIAGDSDRLKQF